MPGKPDEAVGTVNGGEGSPVSKLPDGADRVPMSRARRKSSGFAGRQALYELNGGRRAAEAGMSSPYYGRVVTPLSAADTPRIEAGCR
jgi:hypothetical protein